MTQSADVIQITVPNVPAEVRAKLDELAKKESRSLASYVRLVLENHVQVVEASEAKAANKKSAVPA